MYETLIGAIVQALGAGAIALVFLQLRKRWRARQERRAREIAEFNRQADAEYQEALKDDLP